VAAPARIDADYADVPYPPIHERTYEVRAFRKDPSTVLLRGVVIDLSPPEHGFGLAGGPMEFHHMVVDVEVDVRTFAITAARVVFETNPHEGCPRIADAYQALVGLSIARGYTHKVRELFGGPRGCTHVLALLQAMAPVVMQARWPMLSAAQAEAAAAEAAEAAASGTVAPPRRINDEDRRRMSLGNRDTCHIWASDGEMIARVEAGEEVPPPLPVLARLAEQGIDAEQWWQDRRAH
jgi:hypothetical protein